VEVEEDNPFAAFYKNDFDPECLQRMPGFD